ncbi:MAG TPA: hypothetical protein VMK53_03535 [Gemmatimonadales bacterium]|nr:hypothetical protein [Gemmatimonadales bacterium]
MSVPSVPNRLDRAALDRVLQRAAEMQLSEAEVGDSLTEKDVLDLGRQVGIPGKYLQQAMLEERSKVTLANPKTVLDSWVGPGEVMAQRVVQGDQESIERTLLQWMEKNELVTLQRQQPGRLSWERLGPMQAALRRGASVLHAATARFMLSRAEVVSATITPLEDGFCHVSLTAELRQARGSYIGGAAAAASFGVAGTAVLAALGAMVAITALPVVGGLGIGYLVRRRYPPVAERVQLGLERVLDHVERGAVKASHQLPSRQPGVLELLGGELRKALASSSATPPGDRKKKP